MNKELKSFVTATARRVREVIEAEVDEDHDLCGWCAIASAQLHIELKAAGIKSNICLSCDDWGAHVFLMLEDHVVDVTATQFDKFKTKRVVILHMKEAEQYYFYQMQEMFDTVAQLRRYQRREGWPQDQIAHAT